MAILRWIYEGLHWFSVMFRRGINLISENSETFGYIFFGGFSAGITWLADSLFGKVVAKLWDALTFYTGIQGIGEVLDTGGIAFYILNDCGRLPVAFSWVVTLVTLWGVLRAMLLAKAGVVAALHVIP